MNSACSERFAVTRRDVLRIGGSAVLGLCAGALAQGTNASSQRAKSLIVVHLHGGPSHLDLWDPKQNLADRFASPFRAIPTRVDGVQFTELLPNLARVNDCCTLIRSMSYSPSGLFHHDAALYEALTGRTASSAAASGLLRASGSTDLESDIATRVRLPNAIDACEQFVVLGSTADFLSRSHESGSQREFANVTSAAVCRAFDLRAESVARYGDNIFGRSLLTARRLIEAGVAVVEVIWPWTSPDDDYSWDTHQNLRERMSKHSGPVLDRGLSTLLADLSACGLLEETLVVVSSEFGRSPEKGLSTSGNANSLDGRDHWPYCFTSLVAGAGVRRGHVHGKSDATGSYPVENPVHPKELLVSIYQALGVDALARAVVDAKPVAGLFS